MKEYKVVNLNKAIHMSRDKDLAQMEENINAPVSYTHLTLPTNREV